MKSKFFVITAVTFTLTSGCPAAADTDASILNETFFDIGGPPSDYAYNNQDPGNWSLRKTLLDSNICMLANHLQLT
jgi:hypothetical protein